MITDLSQEANSVFNEAQMLALQNDHQSLEIDHVFSIALGRDDSEAVELISGHGDVSKIKKQVDNNLSSFVKVQGQNANIYVSAELHKMVNEVIQMKNAGCFHLQTKQCRTQ